METRRPSDVTSESNSGDEIQLDATVPPMLSQSLPVPIGQAAIQSLQEDQAALTMMIPDDSEVHAPNEDGVGIAATKTLSKTVLPQGSAKQLPRRLQTLRTTPLTKYTMERREYMLRPLRPQLPVPRALPKQRSCMHPLVRNTKEGKPKEPVRRREGSEQTGGTLSAKEATREHHPPTAPSTFDFSEESDSHAVSKAHESAEAQIARLSPSIRQLFRQMMAEAGIQTEPQTAAGLIGRKRDYSSIDKIPLPSYCYDRSECSDGQRRAGKPILGTIAPTEATTAMNQSTSLVGAVLAAQHRAATKPRWEPPTNIPKLSASVEDYDWWFREMYEHLDSCNVQQDTEKLTFIRNWTTPAFNNHILSKAKHCGVSIDSLRTRFNVFCHFVTSEFTRETDSQALLHKLHDLRNKAHTVDEAYELTERYAFCYNQKAKRAGDTPLSQRTIMMYFAGALQAKVRDYVTLLVQSQNPLAQTLEHAQEAALMFERAINDQPTREAEEGMATSQTVLAAPSAKQQYRSNEGRYKRSRLQRGNYVVRQQHVSSAKPIQQLGDAILRNSQANMIAPPMTAMSLQPFKHRRIEGGQRSPTKTTCREDENTVPQCFHCKRKGHRSAECRIRLRDEARARQGGEIPKCQYCRKMGHKEEECWNKHPHLRPGYGRKEAASLAMHSSPVAQETTAKADMGANHWDTPQPIDRQVITCAIAKALASPEHMHDGTNASDAQASKGIQRQVCRCLLQLKTSFNNVPLRLIIDTGATINLLHQRHLPHILSIRDVPPFSVTDVSGGSQVLTQCATLPLELGGYPYVFDMYITASLPADGILGLDAITEAGWIVDAVDRILIHKTHAIPPVKLSPCHHTSMFVSTQAPVTLQPRAWQWIPVSVPKEIMQHTSSDTHWCITPTPPDTLPILGIPLISDVATFPTKLLLCNTGYTHQEIPAAAQVAIAQRCLWVVSCFWNVPGHQCVVTRALCCERALTRLDDKLLHNRLEKFMRAGKSGKLTYDRKGRGVVL